jgi:hypothetical protein
VTDGYDAESNPRYIGGEEEAPEKVDPADLDVLAEEITKLEEAVEAFAHPGWDHIAVELSRALSASTDQLLANDLTEPIHIGNARGRAQALRYVLTLPVTLARELERARAELRNLSSPPDQEPEEAPES